MVVLRKILSIIFNPFVNFFKTETSVDSSFFESHHFVLGLLTAVLVGAIMVIYYLLVL